MEENDTQFQKEKIINEFLLKIWLKNIIFFSIGYSEINITKYRKY